MIIHQTYLSSSSSFGEAGENFGLFGLYCGVAAPPGLLGEALNVGLVGLYVGLVGLKVGLVGL